MYAEFLFLTRRISSPLETSVIVAGSIRGKNFVLQSGHFLADSVSSSINFPLHEGQNLNAFLCFKMLAALEARNAVSLCSKQNCRTEINLQFSGAEQFSFAKAAANERFFSIYQSSEKVSFAKNSNSFFEIKELSFTKISFPLQTKK